MTAVTTISGQSQASIDIRVPADNAMRLNNNLLALTAGGAIKKIMLYDTTIDAASLADAAGATLAVTGCVGARLGDSVIASCSLDLQDMTLTAYVQASDTIEFRLQNEGGAGVNLASATFTALVFCRN